MPQNKLSCSLEYFLGFSFCIILFLKDGNKITCKVSFGLLFSPTQVYVIDCFFLSHEHPFLIILEYWCSLIFIGGTLFCIRQELYFYFTKKTCDMTVSVMSINSILMIHWITVAQIIKRTTVTYSVVPPIQVRFTHLHTSENFLGLLLVNLLNWFVWDNFLAGFYLTYLSV